MKIKLTSASFLFRKRLLMIAMKMFVFLFCTSVLALTPGNVVSQNSKIKIEEDKTLTVDEVFDLIMNQTDYKFFYEEGIFKDFPQIQLKKGIISTNKLLERSLSRGDFDITVTENHAILIKEKSPNIINDQQITIKGIVKDMNGQPLPGTNILEKGTTNGTQTDFDGKFTLTVEDKNTTLVISYLGFLTKEVAVDGQTDLAIILQEDTAKLDEVVVVGYGSQSKRKVTGAISSINTNIINQTASSSFEQGLVGTTSGIIINQNSPGPGESSNIVIRGTGTLTAGTNPLIVVDGFPLTEGSSFNSINPNDIESIDVLKDAASAAIYGSRAGNGVILVTTKKGKSGKLNVEINSYTGFQSRQDNFKVVDAYDAAQYFTEARDWGYVIADPNIRNESDSNAIRIANGASPRQLRLDYIDPYLQKQSGLTNTDWYNDVIFRTAPINSTNISLSGSNEKTNYYVSGGYFSQDGIVSGSDIKQYTSNVKFKSSISERVDIGVNLNTSFSKQNYINKTGSWDDPDPVALGEIMYPFFPVRNTDGSLAISNQLLANAAQDGALGENVFAMVETNVNKRNAFKSFGNAYLSVNILEGLTFKTLIGGSFENKNYNYFTPSTVGRYRTPASNKQARATETHITSENFLVENTINYKKNFNSHNIEAIVGYSYQEETAKSTEIAASGFVDDNIRNVAGGSIFSETFDQYKWTQISYLGRVSYDYKNKYLVSIAARRDGSSRFGENSKWGVFPSVSLGWVLSEESFLSKNDFLSYAKARVSWGQTGNNQIGSYSSQALVTPDDYVFGNNLTPGFSTNSSPNPNISWETNTSINYGVDLSFLENKLSVNANYYVSNTTDLLLDVPVPQQSGYSESLKNIGEIENKGFEFEFSGQNYQIGNLKIGFNTTLTTNNNKVLALGNGQDQIITGANGAFRTKVGGPIAEMYGYNIIGVFKDQADIDSSPHLAGTYIGDYKMKDLNNDGVINGDDKQGFGTYAPNLTYSFGANFEYRNFDFSFSFYGVEGRKVYDRMLHTFLEFGEAFSMPSQDYFDHRYHPVNNPDGYYARPNTNFSVSSSRPPSRASNLFFKNADYLRLRTVQIGYNFPKNTLSKLGIENLRLYLSANNLFTITDFKGFNPDGTGNGVLNQGESSSSHPTPRIISAGFKLNI